MLCFFIVLFYLHLCFSLKLLTTCLVNIFNSCRLTHTHTHSTESKVFICQLVSFATYRNTYAFTITPINVYQILLIIYSWIVCVCVCGRRNGFEEYIFGTYHFRNRLCTKTFDFQFIQIFIFIHTVCTVLEIFLLGAHIVVVSAAKQIKLNVHNDNNMENTNPHKIHLIWFASEMRHTHSRSNSMVWQFNFNSNEKRKHPFDYSMHIICILLIRWTITWISILLSWVCKTRNRPVDGGGDAVAAVDYMAHIFFFFFCVVNKWSYCNAVPLKRILSLFLVSLFECVCLSIIIII